MIVPLVREEEWKIALSGLPSWRPPQCPTMVISPHPDDETLGAGGLIKSLVGSGVDLSVVAVTDGENAYDRESDWGPIREVEQTYALEALGVSPSKVHRLRLPDSGLGEVEERLVFELRRLIVPGTHIIAPWIGDFHPDHEVCGRAARMAAATVGANVTYYFFWTWHRGRLSTLDGLSLVAFQLAPDEVKAKNDALLCHRSQLEHHSNRPILPPDLLGPMRRPYEVFLPL